MTKKIDLLRAAMEAGNWQKALSMAARFPRLGEHRKAITLGHEAYNHRMFYAQIGKDPDGLISEGIEALQERYPS